MAEGRSELEDEQDDKMLGELTHGIVKAYFLCMQSSLPFESLRKQIEIMERVQQQVIVGPQVQVSSASPAAHWPAYSRHLVCHRSLTPCRPASTTMRALLRASTTRKALGAKAT